MEDYTPSDGSETEKELTPDELTDINLIVPVAPVCNFLMNSDITEERSSSQFNGDQL